MNQEKGIASPLYLAQEYAFPTLVRWSHFSNDREFA